MLRQYGSIAVLVDHMPTWIQIVCYVQCGFLSVSGLILFASEFVCEFLKCGVLASICRKGLGF